MTTPTDDDEYVTMAEACEILDVSRWTVERRVKEGALTKYKVRRGRAGMVRFLRTEVDAVKQADEQAVEQ